MRKLSIIMMLICTLLTISVMTAGCDNDLNVKGKVYKSYGLINSERQDPCVNYEVVEGNVIWSLIFLPSIVIPGWLVLFHLYEPVSIKGECVK